MIVIGSRGSALALWQARHVAARLEALGEQTRIEIIKTSGDKILDVPLSMAGGKGLFTKEIEEAPTGRGRRRGRGRGRLPIRGGGGG